MKRVLPLLLPILIGACATDYSKVPPSEIASHISAIDSGFDKTRLFAAPEVKGGEFLLRYSARLVAVQEKSTGVISNSLHVTWNYTGGSWLFFQSVSLQGGYRPITKVTKRTVGSCSGRSCSYEESVASTIPLDALAQAKDGLRVRYDSLGGVAFVDLPTNYVLGYLQGVAAQAK